MKDLDRDGKFVLSLPSSALRVGVAEQSFLAAEQLSSVQTSPTLKAVLDLMVSYLGTTLVGLLPRAELFTSNSAFEWLDSAAGGVTAHVHLTDGLTVKLLPRIENHVFFYAPMHTALCQSKVNIARRCPEALLSVTSQINSAHEFTYGAFKHKPESLVIRSTQREGTATYVMPEQALSEVFVDRSQPELAIARMKQWCHRLDVLRSYERLTILAVSERALADSQYANLISRSIVATAFDKRTALVLAVMPGELHSNLDLGDATAIVANALSKTGVEVPAVRLSNVFVASGGAITEILGSGMEITLVVDEGFPFWFISSNSFKNISRCISVGLKSLTEAENFSSLLRKYIGFEVFTLCASRSRSLW